MASEQLEATIAMMREMKVMSGDLAADRSVISSSPVMPEGVPHEMVTVAGRAAAWITADARTDAAVLYLHGGAYVMGGLSTHGAFAARLSTDTGVAVLALDYRLAPEDPFPAALDDAVAGFDWLIGRGIDAERIIVAGDSAGGGLTIATLAALRERGVTAAAGVALSPWADLTCTNSTHTTLADADPMVAPDHLRTYAEAYANGHPLDDPRLSPGLGDLAGLPPVLIQVGGLEVLLDDSRRLAAGIDAAGGEVTLQEWDEAIHVFQMLGAPESDEAIAEIVSFIAGRL
ncbi:MAG: alpha/beta hydrolase [Acidimicrobiales bacterium]